MNFKELVKNWYAEHPIKTESKHCTLSEGYRAYWEMKQEMWKRTKFNPLNKK